MAAVRSHTEMPPTPHYELLASNARAGGAAMRKVEYTRTVGDADYDPENGWVAGVDEQRSLRSWLCSLGARETARACGLQSDRTVGWAGDHSLRRAVRGMQLEAHTRFDAMARELQRLRLVQAEDVPRVSAQFELVLRDRRGNAREPLPTKEWLLGDEH